MNMLPTLIRPTTPTAAAAWAELIPSDDVELDHSKLFMLHQYADELFGVVSLDPILHGVGVIKHPDSGAASIIGAFQHGGCRPVSFVHGDGIMWEV